MSRQKIATHEGHSIRHFPDTSFSINNDKTHKL